MSEIDNGPPKPVTKNQKQDKKHKKPRYLCIGLVIACIGTIVVLAFATYMIIKHGTSNISANNAVSISLFASNTVLLIVPLFKLLYRDMKWPYYIAVALSIAITGWCIFMACKIISPSPESVANLLVLPILSLLIPSLTTAYQWLRDKTWIQVKTAFKKKLQTCCRQHKSTKPRRNENTNRIAKIVWIALVAFYCVEIGLMCWAAYNVL